MRNRFVTFKTWGEVLEHAVGGHQLYYHAPLDAQPCAIMVAKIYKNGKIRIDPMTRDADPFTADRGHLDRMCKVPRHIGAKCATPDEFRTLMSLAVLTECALIDEDKSFRVVSEPKWAEILRNCEGTEIPAVERVTCAGCGERFPCSDSDRRDIDPIERAKHFAKEV